MNQVTSSTITVASKNKGRSQDEPQNGSVQENTPLDARICTKTCMKLDITSPSSALQNHSTRWMKVANPYKQNPQANLGVWSTHPNINSFSLANVWRFSSQFNTTENCIILCLSGFAHNFSETGFMHIGVYRSQHYKSNSSQQVSTLMSWQPYFKPATEAWHCSSSCKTNAIFRLFRWM